MSYPNRVRYPCGDIGVGYEPLPAECKLCADIARMRRQEEAEERLATLRDKVVEAARAERAALKTLYAWCNIPGNRVRLEDSKRIAAAEDATADAVDALEAAEKEAANG